MCVATALVLSGTLAEGGALAATFGAMTVGEAIFADIGLLSGGVSAFGSLQTGKAQAKNFRRQAEFEQQQQELRDSDRRRRTASLVATQRALFGASGVVTTSGSPLDVFENTVREGELGIVSERFASSARQDTLRNNAQVASFEGTTEATGTLLNFASRVGQRG